VERITHENCRTISCDSHKGKAKLFYIGIVVKIYKQNVKHKPIIFQTIYRSPVQDYDRIGVKGVKYKMQLTEGSQRGHESLSFALWGKGLTDFSLYFVWAWAGVNASGTGYLLAKTQLRSYQSRCSMVPDTSRSHSLQNNKLNLLSRG